MEAYMISSRQVVELIEEKIVTEYDPNVKTAFKNLVDEIEVLEGIEMDKMYKDFVDHEENERKRKEEIRAKAEEEFKRAFAQS